MKLHSSRHKSPPFNPLQLPLAGDAMKTFFLCLALVVVVEILWKLVRLLLSRFSVSSKPNEHQIFVTLSACYMMLTSKPFLESKFLEDDLGLDPLFFEEFFLHVFGRIVQDIHVYFEFSFS